ncbi:MAG: Sapep family Mn(2+)-dependent dipeptidase [Erysipelotrichaceae bacterium]
MEWMKLQQNETTDFIQDLRGLLNVHSVLDTDTAKPGAPFGEGVAQAMEYMKQLGLREGFRVKEYEGYALVLEYGEGEESIGVLGHLDIVPIGEGWTKEPLAGEIIDGYMFARGVMDDKGPSMAAFYAVKKIKEQAIKLNRRILLIFGGDEESGMGCMDYYAKHGEIPTMGIVPDASFPAVYGEKGILRLELAGEVTTKITKMNAGTRPNIVIGKADAIVSEWSTALQATFDFYLEANNLTGRVEQLESGAHIFIDGVFSHAAWPYNGVNAAIHILNFVGSAMQDRFAKACALMLQDWRGTGAGMEFEGAYMGFLTMNPGIVQIEDQKASITLDIRYPNDTSLEAITSGLQAKLDVHAPELALLVHEHVVPLFMDPNSEFIKTLEQAYRKVSGDTFTPLLTMGGGTYARKLPNCVAFGPEFPLSKVETTEFLGGPHQKDEAMKLQDLYNAVEIYCDVLVNLTK